MTNIELPSAAEALAAAYAIVKSPCSAAETERATLLFEIGRELRIAADMRAMNARRAALDEARNYRVKTPSPAAYEPTVANGWAGEPAAARVERLCSEAVIDEPTQLAPIIDEPTSQFAIVWGVGDKADCAHCHTPIVFAPRRMKDPLQDTEDDGATQYVWVHKYSDRRTCADASIDEGHTFAEPSR